MVWFNDEDASRSMFDDVSRHVEPPKYVVRTDANPVISSRSTQSVTSSRLDY
jgi:hypothetical protein